MKKIKLLIVGAGERGTIHAGYAGLHPELAEVVGVVEPRTYYREKMAADYQIAPEHVFTDWPQVLPLEPFYDAVVIATPDAVHAEPAIAFAEKKVAILLEKPMATNQADCERIVEAVSRNRILFCVCHVLRYTEYTQTLKAVLDSGRIGEIVSIQHLEPVGYWHQAHSYVRGNWRNEKESSFMLLAKSCHDMDWLRYLMGRRCSSVSSFGSRYCFRAEKQPVGAADRCLDCSIEADCPYSAMKIYLARAQTGNFDWPVKVITSDLTEGGVMDALQNGPYGRCVWACDNDVVDHQVVNMVFENGQTASFTMTGFTAMSQRKTRVFGTRGQVEGDGRSIVVQEFLGDTSERIEIPRPVSGHGGGDGNLMEHFIQALIQEDPSQILSGAQESLETHRMTFAAEQSRKSLQVISLQQ